MTCIARRHDSSLLNRINIPANKPTSKNGRPRPIPNANASGIPNSGRAVVAATVNKSSSGAAEVPRLKMKPYKNEPNMPGLRKDESCSTPRLGPQNAATAAIKETKARTSKPFGVNLTILPTINPPPYDEYRQVIVDAGIKIVETAGFNPAPHLPMFHDNGIKVLHKCTSVRP